MNELSTTMKRIHITGLGLIALMAQSMACAQVDERAAVTSPEAAPVLENTVPVTEPVAAAAPAAAPTERRTNVLVEEVVVTAQKREENLQDVPLSVQAFSGAKLETLGVNNSVDLPRITPGLVLTETIGYVTTYIRGLGSDAFAFADPSVAIYIDGIYNPSATTATQDFGPVERIEVLKGPQGTLFGRNAIGGAINIVTKPVSFEHPESTASVTWEDYGAWRTRASIGVPLTDTLAFSVSALYNRLDSYVDGKIEGKPLDETVQRGARGKIRWAPIDSFELNLAASTVKSAGPGGNYVVNTNPTPLGSLLLIQPQDPFGGNINEFPAGAGFEETLYSAQANVYTDGFDVKLFGSQQDVVSRQGLDFDGSAMPIALLAVEPRISDIKTAELQIVSNDTSWGSDTFNWIVGAYYFDGHDGYQDALLRVADTQIAPQLTLLGASLPLGLGDALGFLNGLPVPTGTLGFSGLLDTTSYAAYFQTTYNFTDWAALTLGGRYQSEERAIDESTSYARLADGSVLYLPGHRPETFSCDTDRQYCDTTKAFSPKVSIDIRPVDGTLLYLSWQKATKSSTFNTINIYDLPEFVPEERVTAYEAGIKTTLFDGLMSLNAAAFYYELRDLQVQFVSLLTGGALTFEPAEEASVKGVEIDTLVQILPDMVDDLILTASATVLDAQYDKLENANGFDPATGLYSPNGSYSGNQIVRSPDFTGTLGLNKTFVVPVGAIEIGADYYYNSGFFFLAQNQPDDEQPSYGLLGARVTLVVDAWGMRISAFGKNLTNERYFHTRLPADFGALDYPAQKSVFGLQASWELR